MATTGRSYPLPAYNFRVTLDGAALNFSEVSGIVLKHETVTYRHGFSFMEGEDIAKFRFDEFAPITFKRGTAAGAKELADWVAEKDPRALEVSLCDEEGVPVVAWKIARAIATKLTAPSFSASTNEVAIESLEVMAAGITVEHV